jgi:2-C-methyl-D-erythritol 2,4-cyclodiphosphate synthase
LLTAVVARLADMGWRPAGLDVTIVGLRPRLGGHLDAIRASIAGLLGLAPDAVNVKASTGNLDGSEGAGRSISTLALATIELRQ